MTETPEAAPKRNLLSYIFLMLLTGLNAFNDNFARFLLVPLGGWIAFWGTEHFMGVLVALPFVLCAPSAGWLSDRFAKNVVLVGSAFLQLLALGCMLLALWLRIFPLALGAFFLLALQSALFSPAKSGIIRELLGAKRLTLGSGIGEGITILAVLAGQIWAGLLFDDRLESGMDGWEAAFLPLVILTVVCLAAVVLALSIQKTPAQSEEKFSAAIAFRHFTDVSQLWSERILRLSSLGVAFFWGFATFIVLAVWQVAVLLHNGEEGTATANSLMMATASIGIAAGSIFAGWWCRKRNDLGLAVFGGLGMILGSLVLAFSQPGGLIFRIGLFGSGAGGAVFLVPLKALLINESPKELRGKFLGVSNLFNNLAGLLAIALQFLLKALHAPLMIQFLVLGLSAAAITVFLLRLLPRRFWFTIGKLLLAVSYRVETRGEDRMPKEGGLILCPNHMTFVDALVMTVSSPRAIRFLIAEECYRHKFVGHFAQLFDAVPVTPKRAKEAIRIAAEEAASGNVVCLFPEGQLSRSGGFCEIKQGFQMIARKARCPVQVAYMHGLWDTYTSFSGGRYFHKWPRFWAKKLIVSFSEPVAPREASSEWVEECWREMARTSLIADGALAAEKNYSPKVRKYSKYEPNRSWPEKIDLFQARPVEEREALWKEAYRLASVAFWQRGERILLEWEESDLGEVLALLLPSLVAVKVRVIAPGASATEWQREIEAWSPDRITLVSKECPISKPVDELQVQLLASWQGNEAALSQPNIFPAHLIEGQVVSWSMPHPDEPGSKIAKFQPGKTDGSIGKGFPSTVAPEGFQADENHFWFLKKDETRLESESASD